MEDSLTAEESQELEGYINDPALGSILQNSIKKALNSPDEDEDQARNIDELVEGLESKVLQRIDGLEKSRLAPIKSYWLYAAAATVAVLLSLGMLIYSLSKPSAENGISSAARKHTDIAPGTNRATLVLANGKNIPLSEAVEGISVSGGIISYENGTVVLDHAVQQYLTLTVPRGGKYKLKLADGTQVWLNAASSLKYPSTFQDNERVVEVQGEAYFEVQKDPAHPFIVKTEKQTIKVLGTAFNVNTYSNDKTTTTLLHGSIALTNVKGVDKILLPGDQAVVKADLFKISKVNTQDYIAWKDDLIMLNDQDIHDIFKQLERWYDVEFVNIESIQANKNLSGEIPRNTNLSAILQALEEQIHVKFEINGRRIMIKS